MFQLKLTTKNIDIHSSSGIVRNGWCNITIDKSGILVYINKDKTRIYWLGKTAGQGAKLTIKFNDDKHMISVNSSNKIVFHNIKDYNKLKQKTIFYKHMKEGENSVVFS